MLLLRELAILITQIRMENDTSLSIEEQLRISKSETERLALENCRLSDQLRYTVRTHMTRVNVIKSRYLVLGDKVKILEQKLAEKNRELENTFYGSSCLQDFLNEDDEISRLKAQVKAMKAVILSLKPTH